MSSSPKLQVDLPKIDVLAWPDGETAGSEAVQFSLGELQIVLGRWRDSAAANDWVSERLTRLSIHPVPLGLTPERGWIGRFPLYCALWCQPASETLVRLGRIAQSALVAACVSIAESHHALTNYAPAVLSAGLAVRHLLQGNIDETRLDALRSADSMEDVHFHILSLISTHLTEHDVSRIRGLSTLLGYAVTERVPRSGSSRSRAMRKTRSGQDKDSPFPAYAELEDTYAPRLDEDGGAPIPEFVGRRIALLPPDNRAQGLRVISTRQAYFRARQASRAIQTRAQGLLAASDRLQLVDISALNTAISELLKNKPSVSTDLESGLVLLTASLLLGCPASQLSTITIRQSHSLDLHKPHRKSLLTPTHWILPVTKLPSAYVPPLSDRELYRAPVACIVLRLPDLPFRDVIEHYFKKLPALFEMSRADILADSACRYINSMHNARLTPSRVAGFLERQIYAMTGDWADAAFFITGVSDSAEARRYYYAPRHDYVSGRYDEVWRAVEQVLGLRRSTVQVQQIGAGACVGSAACPTLAAVRQMVHEQIRICRETRVGRPNFKRQASRHNALALYTWLMLMWLSGARAVDDAINLSLYDSATGLLQLSDKDTDEYYASRLAWMPDVAQQQINVYLQHVELLTLDYPGTLPRQLFFIAENNNTLEPLTLRRVRGKLDPDYPFPLNAQRHFLRTELRERGTPAECVDALLGHGSSGQEPYGTHTCYSARELITELREPLTRISDQCGWKVLAKL